MTETFVESCQRAYAHAALGYSDFSRGMGPATRRHVDEEQNRGFWREEFYRHEDPRGREYFWLTGEFVNGEPEATDTDEWALTNKYVAVVPVQVDLTDYRQLKNLRYLEKDQK